MPLTNKNVDMLDGLQKQIGTTVETIQSGQPLKSDGSPITDPAELHQYYVDLQQKGMAVGELGDVINNIGEERDQQSQDMNKLIASNWSFSIKTAQGFPGVMNPYANPSLGQGGPNGGMGGHSGTVENIQFTNSQSVRDVLDAIGNAPEATHLFIDRFGNDNSIVQDPDNPVRESPAEDAIRDPINEYFSTDDNRIKDKVAQFLLDNIISNSAKNENVQEEQSEVPTKLETNIHPHTASIVHNTNAAIKKLAEAHAKQLKSPKSVFNLQKEAQHKALENVFTLNRNHTDAFTGQLITDWHLVERNKGFGLKIDGIHNIDFETIWRNNIMDKYDPEYIERRFEVDKNLPPTNNMQLKPGEKRKPYVPEYALTEARLQKNRGEEVFNWAKEASNISNTKEAENKDTENFHPCGKCLICKPCHCKKAWNSSGELKKKVAQVKELPELPTFNEEKPMQPQRWCPICKSKMRNAVGSSGANPNECPSCKAIVPTPLTTDPQMGRVEDGNQQVPQNNPTTIQTGTNLSSYGGIFYNGEKFVVYAEKDEDDEDKDGEEFDDFESAEKFFSSMQINKNIPHNMLGGGMGTNVPEDASLANPYLTRNNYTEPTGLDDVDECDIPVHPNKPLDKRKQDIHNSMQSLAIDE